MQNYMIINKAFSILLLLSLIMLSGCASVTEDLSDKVSEGVTALKEVEDVSPEETSPVEILSEEGETDTTEPVISEEKWARIPMVMVDCSEIPTENNQSNFGFEGTGYQYGATEGTIELYIDEKWWIYATEEVRHELQFTEE